MGNRRPENKRSVRVELSKCVRLVMHPPPPLLTHNGNMRKQSVNMCIIGVVYMYYVHTLVGAHRAKLVRTLESFRGLTCSQPGNVRPTILCGASKSTLDQHFTRIYRCTGVLVKHIGQV